MTKIKPKRNLQIQNRKAYFEYHILETWTSGIVLQGTEVKSIREGKCNMTDSYCFFVSGELFIKDLDIPIGTTSYQHDPKRPKKLLLNRKELNKMEKGLDNGVTIIPLKIYEVGGRFKMDIALVKGKKLFDKRASLKEKDVKRDLERL
jgi:SsrA-binding protein